MNCQCRRIYMCNLPRQLYTFYRGRYDSCETVISGGSRISRRGGRAPVRGVIDLWRGHFSVKMYAKMKELGPMGGRMPGTPLLDPPMVIMNIEYIMSRICARLQRGLAKYKWHTFLREISLNIWWTRDLGWEESGVMWDSFYLSS